VREEVKEAIGHGSARRPDIENNIQRVREYNSLGITSILNGLEGA
jgi:hypothetical protein